MHADIFLSSLFYLAPTIQVLLAPPTACIGPIICSAGCICILPIHTTASWLWCGQDETKVVEKFSMVDGGLVMITREGSFLLLLRLLLFSAQPLSFYRGRSRFDFAQNSTQR